MKTPYTTVPATNKKTVGVKEGYKYLTKKLSHSSGKKPAIPHRKLSIEGGSSKPYGDYSLIIRKGIFNYEGQLVLCRYNSQVSQGIITKKTNVAITKHMTSHRVC